MLKNIVISALMLPAFLSYADESVGFKKRWNFCQSQES